MNNTVIKVLNKEHGKQVIQWWKDQGIDTKNYIGNYTEVNRDAFCYYGVINDKFDNYHFSDVTSNNTTIIELPIPKEDDLLAEVRRRYPIGTKFHTSKTGVLRTVNSNVRIYSNSPLIFVCDTIENDQLAEVYTNGKWAEIVTTSKEEPSKFVIGKWYTAEGYYGKLCGEVTSDRFPCTEYFHKSGKYQKDGSYFCSYEWKDAKEVDLSEIQKYLPDGHPDKFPAQNYDSITFKQIPSIEKWSVDSYVVFLEDYGGHSKGTVSKIIKNSSKHNVQVEHLYNSMPGNGCNLSKDRECKWFATLQEAEKFAAILKEPVETPTESMIGRWVKVVKGSTSEQHPIDTYLQIKTEINHLDCFWVYGFDRCLSTTEVEIMPEGFIPPSASIMLDHSDVTLTFTLPHVKKLVKENLVGRWVKSLVDRPDGCSLKAGEYAKIVDVTDLSIRLDLPYSPFISASSLIKDIMLMPKEFKRAEIAEEMWSRINRPVDCSSKDSIGRIKVKKRAVKKISVL